MCSMIAAWYRACHKRQLRASCKLTMILMLLIFTAAARLLPAVIRYDYSWSFLPHGTRQLNVLSMSSRFDKSL